MPKQATLKSQSVDASVSVTSKDKVISQESVKVAEIVSLGPTANVGFSATFTKNLGNYESIKIGVSLYYPINVSQSEFDAAALDTTMERIQTWVDDRMAKVISELETGS